MRNCTENHPTDRTSVGYGYVTGIERFTDTDILTDTIWLVWKGTDITCYARKIGKLKKIPYRIFLFGYRSTVLAQKTHVDCISCTSYDRCKMGTKCHTFGKFCDTLFPFCTTYGRPLAPRDDGLVGENTTSHSIKKYGRLCGTSTRDLGDVAARTNWKGWFL